MSTTDTFSFTIDLRAVKAAAYAMGKDETRYHLKGVCLDISPTMGAVAVATDGCRLIACLAAEPNAVPSIPTARAVIIPADTVKRIKLSRHVFDATIRENGDGTWSVLYGDDILTFRPIDAAFPEWRRVLPSHRDAGARAHINPDFLADFKSAGEVYVKGTQPAVIEHGEDPAWVLFRDDIPAVGVVAPMRRHVADRMNVPAWATRA